MIGDVRSNLRRSWLSLFLSSGFLVSPLLGNSSPVLQNPGKLAIILRKTGEYCERLDRIALNFVCLEDIHERIYDPYRFLLWHGRFKVEEKTFLYDYQLTRKEGVEETRVLLRENREPRSVKNAPLKTRRFNYKHVIFGPGGLFGLKAQKNNVYEIEDETTIWGNPAVIVKAVPLQVENAGWLYGRAWLSPADGRVFKIEWEENSIENYEAVVEFAKKFDAKPALQFDSEYQFEKNGIQFPSRCTIKEIYVQHVRKIIKSELTVTYRNYRFFVVEVEVR